VSRKTNLLSVHRLEGLTDGIYAIAMTIMVLGLPLPKTIHNIDSNSDLLDHLFDYSELFWTYLLSFLLLGNFWIIQQKLFKYVKITLDISAKLPSSGKFLDNSAETFQIRENYL
jgi:uncharacterized membrane protein